MYDIIKDRITAGGYRLADIQHKVKKLYIWGDLTEDQVDELLKMAAAGVSADAERPEVMEMLRRLADRVATLEAARAPDEGSGSEEIEEWEPWDGISDKYQKGDTVIHNGFIWESVFEGKNVWEPGTVGTEYLWAKREEA